MKYVVKTLGCKANLADTQEIEQALQAQGWTEGEGSDVSLCIVNSCSVTNEADKQSRKLATQLSQQFPQARVVMTGCGAEINPEGMQTTKGVDLVVGNQNKNQLVPLVLSHIDSHILNQNTPHTLGTLTPYTELLSRHPIDREWPAGEAGFQAPVNSLLIGQSQKTRAFLKIQAGCDSFCTYCIIPYGRGPSRSLGIDATVSRIQELVRLGIREVILTGTNIGEYGSDWGSENPQLERLLEAIFQSTSIERVRLSSLNPVEITSGILSIMKIEKRLCPHFHVSLQSPHPKILKLMKRKYTADDVVNCLNGLASVGAEIGIPGGIFIGMDVITGFPGETDEDFEWTVERLRSLPWTRLHVFPYSERAKTPATKLPGVVPRSTRYERAKVLNQLSLERQKALYQSLLDRCNHQPFQGVLAERQSEDGSVSGYTPNYLRVWVPEGQDLPRNQYFAAQPLDLMVDTRANDVAFICRKTPHSMVKTGS